jgi:hypothetical protein
MAVLCHIRFDTRFNYSCKELIASAGSYVILHCEGHRSMTYSPLLVLSSKEYAYALQTVAWNVIRNAFNMFEVIYKQSSYIMKLKHKCSES